VKREPQGLVSRWLHDELKVGDEVEIEAPNGTFVFCGEEAQSIVLIGAGIGITPMMSVARYLTETHWPGNISMVLGFRAPVDFVFREELEELRRRSPNLSTMVTMSNPGDEAWSGARGRIGIELLASAVQDIAQRRAHICGPPAMMNEVKMALSKLGLPEYQVRTEAFGTVTRDPTAKGARSGNIAGNVVFQASDTTAPVPADATILEVADDVGVFIDCACRSGTCASCRVKLLSGKVSMAVQDALTDQDKAEGYILACQAKIQGDVKVDA
jgi:ferredoxin-NADP reductase